MGERDRRAWVAAASEDDILGDLVGYFDPFSVLARPMQNRLLVLEISEKMKSSRFGKLD